MYLVIYEKEDYVTEFICNYIFRITCYSKVIIAMSILKYIIYAPSQCI